MHSYKNEETECLLASMPASRGEVLKSCLITYVSGGGTCVDVNARCILGSFNICGTDKNKHEFTIY